jgi:Holliday junction resolvase RusA-like endonuclease
MKTLAFTVYGEAQPQGSAKAFIPKGWKRPIITSDNPDLKSWRQLVSEAANRALAQLPKGDRDYLLEGVRLTIAFYLPRPKSLPKRATAHTKKPDIDKCVRAILDALTSIAFRDDSQVCELVTVKHYAAAGAAPHVDIRVEPTMALEPIRVPAALLPLFTAERMIVK